MQFRGPTKGGDDWAGQNKLEIIFDTPDELEKTFEQFLRKGFCLVRVSPSAKLGDRKELVLELPDGERLTFFASLEKLKEPNEKPYLTALFRLIGFDSSHLGRIEAFLKKANAKEVSTDSILDGGFAFDLDSKVPPKAASKSEFPAAAPRRTSLRNTSLRDAAPTSQPTSTAQARSTSLPEPPPPAQEARRTTALPFDEPQTSQPQRRASASALPEGVPRSRRTTSLRSTNFERAVIEQQHVTELATMGALVGEADAELALEAMLNDTAPVDETPITVELPEELRGSAGDMLMPKKEGQEHDPQLEIKKYTVAFVLLFTKSVQRSGYYADPNHPETIKSKKGLYGLFRKIVGNKREVNFVRKTIGKERDLLIDGALDEMSSLSSIMPHGMVELYIPRFLEYLERRCLISLSIKRSINESRFNAFIDLMSKYAPEFRDNSRKEGERFTKSLQEAGIYEVSAIFDEDMIASGRKLPWQVELTLARLRKDLKTLPLLRNATETDLLRIKLNIFRDTIRPLRNPSFLITILTNSDLIMEHIADIPSLRDIDVEGMVIEGAEIRFLAETSKTLVTNVNEAAEQCVKAQLETNRQQAAELEANLRRLLQRISDRFLKDESEAPAVDEALENLYLNQLLEFSVLPLRIQEKITNDRLMDTFLRKSDEILERFQGPLNDKEFSDFLNRFQRVVPLLAARDEFVLVGRIIEAASRHLNDRDTRRRSMTKRLFDTIASPAIYAQLRSSFLSDDKAMRQMAATVFVVFGVPTVPLLLDVLKTNEDKWIRKRTLQVLTQIGSAATPAIINELYKEDNPWYFMRNLISLLSDAGDQKAVGKLTLLLYHAHPSVREETLEAITKLSPQSAESYLLKALDDQVPQVRERAIACLGRLRSQSEKVLRIYIDILDGKVALANEALQVQVYRALGQLSNLDESKRHQVEEALLRNLEGAVSQNWRVWLGLAPAISADLSDAKKVAICEALGALGRSRKAEQVLKRMTKEHDSVLAQKATNALTAVETRLKRG